MPVVQLPDGNKVDLGDNPSQELINQVHDVIDRQNAAQAAKSPDATSTATSTAPAESTTTSPTSGSPPPKRDPGWGPTIARTAGPILGGVAGIPLGPAGVIGGTALGATAGDLAAQQMEIEAGQRDKINPLRTVAEVGTNVAFAGLPMGDAIMTAVAKAGTLGVVSSNAISMSEGKGINSPGQNAIAFLTAGGLQGITHYAGARAQSVKEISGVPQIEEHVDVMTRPDAPVVGPDGSPMEIPPPTLLDEFGKPVPMRTQYPLPAEQPGPVGPTTTTAGETPFAQPGDVKVGQTPVQRPTGLNMSSSRSQKKQAVMDTWAEQRRPGIFDAQPTKKEIPPLEEPTQPILEPDGGMADLHEQATAGKHDIPGNGELYDPSDLTKHVMRYTGRTKTYFKRLEDETGYPVYQDYDKLSQANKDFQGYRQELTSSAGKALRGTDRSDWTAIIQDTVAGADGGSLSPKLRAKAETIRSVADKALEPYGITSRDLFTEFLPAMAGGDANIINSDKFTKFGEALIDGKINLKTSDLPRMMQQLTNMGAFESRVGQTVRDLQQKYSANPEIPKAIKDAINYYTGALDGTPDRLAKGLGGAITHLGDKFGWEVNGDGIANRIVSTQYAAMMAGRMGPTIRNALQPWQTASAPMGFSWLANGYIKALTKEGRALVEASNVGADSMMNELASIGTKTGLGRFTDASISLAMAPFGAAENINRGAVYLGTRAKVLWAAERYGDDINKFLSKSGVGRYTSQEANIVMDLMARGKVEEAAGRAAEMMVDNTQFMYSQFERPRTFTGAGRTLGAFGMWPTQYSGYLARLGQRGANGTWWEVGRDYSRFLVANSALLGAFYGMGKFVNDETALQDNLGWLFVGPAVYTGSPLLQSLTDGGKIIQQGLQGKPPTGKEVWRAAAPFVPFSGMGMDIVKARKEPDLTEGLARYTGVKRGASPKDKSFGAYKSKSYGSYGKF